jgi:SP family myo-inositol transporter-like MFS transporter 13
MANLIDDDGDRRQASAPRTGGRLPVLVATSCLGGLLFGYDTGVISGAMVQLKSGPAYAGTAGGFDLSTFQQEMVVSATVGGAIAGAALSGVSSSRYGRRLTLLAAAAMFTLGAAVMGAAGSYVALVLGRFVVGISVGSASSVVPMYIAEAAPASTRGQLIVANNVMTVLGQVLASLVDCAFAKAKTREGWRFMLGLGGVPSFLMLLGFLRLPESPRWLLQQGREEEAFGALRLIRGTRAAAGSEGDGNGNGGDGDDDLRRELTAVRDQLSEAAQAGMESGGGWRRQLAEVLREGPLRSALTLGCMLQLLQQLAGINTLMYYSATILQMSDNGSANDPDPFNAASTNAICLSAATAAAQMVGNLAGAALVERSGRRTLMLWSLCGVTVTLAALGLSFMFKAGGSWTAAAMVAYLFVFGIGLAPMPWTVNAEIYPLHAKSLCMSIATSVNWISNYVVSATFLTLGNALSTDRVHPEKNPDGAFFLFGAISAAGWFWVYANMPETKGLSLEEITSLFEKRKGEYGVVGGGVSHKAGQ